MDINVDLINFLIKNLLVELLRLHINMQLKMNIILINNKEFNKRKLH